LEKISAMPLVCGGSELQALRHVKESFDPYYLSNPGKILPPQEGEERGERDRA